MQSLMVYPKNEDRDLGGKLYISTDEFISKPIASAASIGNYGEWPSEYMVRFENRMHRIYSRCYGNGATLLIRSKKYGDLVVQRDTSLD